MASSTSRSFSGPWALSLFVAVLLVCASFVSVKATPFLNNAAPSNLVNATAKATANVSTAANQTLTREQQIQKLNATIYDFLVRHQVNDALVTSWVSEDAPLLPWLSDLFNSTDTHKKNITVAQFASRFSEEVVENDGDVNEMSDPMFWESAFSMMHEKPDFRSKLEASAERAKPNLTQISTSKGHNSTTNKNYDNSTSADNANVNTTSPYDKFHVESPKINLELELIGLGEMITEHAEIALPTIIGASYNDQVAKGNTTK